MTRVFISGYVSEAALRSAVRGAVVHASIDKSDGQVLWQGATDDAGAFGFELQPDEHPHACALVIELHLDQKRVGRAEVTWEHLAVSGAHVDMVIAAPHPRSPRELPPLPFPIGFPPVLERPTDVPVHPMAALPFLIQRSYPRDPEEEEGGGNHVAAPAGPRSLSDPP
jgi:hypothetical protein